MPDLTSEGMVELIKNFNSADKERQKIVIEILKPARNVTYQSEESPKNYKKVDNLEGEVTELITKVGVPANIKGYEYLRTAILLCIKDKEVINAVTKTLYPTVAKKYGTTPIRVERSIRHALEVAWSRGDFETLNEIFGYTVCSKKGKATNSEFIAKIADNFRMKNSIV